MSYPRRSTELQVGVEPTSGDICHPYRPAWRTGLHDYAIHRTGVAIHLVAVATVANPVEQTLVGSGGHSRGLEGTRGSAAASTGTAVAATAATLDDGHALAGQRAVASLARRTLSEALRHHHTLALERALAILAILSEAHIPEYEDHQHRQNQTEEIPFHFHSPCCEGNTFRRFTYPSVPNLPVEKR